MGARQWLIGCALLIGGGGIAAAAGMDTQELGSLQHAGSEGSNRDASGSNSGGDVVGLGHDGTAPASSSGGGGNGGGSGDGTHRSGLDNSSSRRVNLGWQSLLPGAIQ